MFYQPKVEWQGNNKKSRERERERERERVIILKKENVRNK